MVFNGSYIGVYGSFIGFNRLFTSNVSHHTGDNVCLMAFVLLIGCGGTF